MTIFNKFYIIHKTTFSNEIHIFPLVRTKISVLRNPKISFEEDKINDSHFKRLATKKINNSLYRKLTYLKDQMKESNSLTSESHF